MLCQEVNATCDLCASGTRDGTVSQFEFHTWWARSSRSGVMEHGEGGGAEGVSVGVLGLQEAVAAARRRERGSKQPRESGG